ncbi:MAG: hypothetical protein ACI4ME_10055, partial [Aristaeellaceae bacterium]
LAFVLSVSFSRFSAHPRGFRSGSACIYYHAPFQLSTPFLNFFLLFALLFRFPNFYFFSLPSRSAFIPAVSGGFPKNRSGVSALICHHHTDVPPQKFQFK